MPPLTKTAIARRQLGTALALYLQGKDPVSVHCLACGGCEIAEQLAASSGSLTLRHFTLLANPALDDKDYVSIRNQYWNAFKHASDRKGNARNDDDLLATFTTKENEERLFVGWSDYGFATSLLPIEAQVFCTWFLALDGSRFAPDQSDFLKELDRVFPNLRNLSPEQQLRRLRRTIERCKGQRALMNDPKTEQLPLILPSD